jgi:hypothetical protein
MPRRPRARHNNWIKVDEIQILFSSKVVQPEGVGVPHADGRGLCRWVDNAFRFLDCFVLAAFLVVQYEVDYINGFAVGIAVGGEAKSRLVWVL